MALVGVLVLAFAIRDVRHYGWLALGALALAAYAGVLVATGAIDRAEVALVRDLLARRRPDGPPTPPSGVP